MGSSGTPPMPHMTIRRFSPTAAPRLSAALAALVVFAVSLVTLQILRDAPPVPLPPVAFARDTDGRIAAAQARIDRDPASAGALTELAQASLDKLREVGDPNWYATPRTPPPARLRSSPVTPRPWT